MSDLSDPLTLSGSQFLAWVRDQARDEGHVLRSREESAAARGMQSNPYNLATADALAAMDEMISEMLLIGNAPMIVRIVKAGRAAVQGQTAKRKNVAAA